MYQMYMKSLITVLLSCLVNKLMADRTILHINKLPMFTWWLSSLGYDIQTPKSVSEVLRAKKGEELVVIYKRFDAKEHLTVQQKDIKLVKTFIKQHVEIKRNYSKVMS